MLRLDGCRCRRPPCSGLTLARPSSRRGTPSRSAMGTMTTPLLSVTCWPDGAVEADGPLGVDALEALVARPAGLDQAVDLLGLSPPGRPWPARYLASVSRLSMERSRTISGRRRLLGGRRGERGGDQAEEPANEGKTRSRMNVLLSGTGKPNGRAGLPPSGSSGREVDLLILRSAGNTLYPPGKCQAACPVSGKQCQRVRRDVQRRQRMQSGLGMLPERASPPANGIAGGAPRLPGAWRLRLTCLRAEPGEVLASR